MCRLARSGRLTLTLVVAIGCLAPVAAGAADGGSPPRPPILLSGGVPVHMGRGTRIRVVSRHIVSCSYEFPCQATTTATAVPPAPKGRARARRSAAPIVVGERHWSATSFDAAWFWLNRAGRAAFAQAGRLRMTITTTAGYEGSDPVVATHIMSISPRTHAQPVR